MFAFFWLFLPGESFSATEMISFLAWTGLGKKKKKKKKKKRLSRKKLVGFILDSLRRLESAYAIKQTIKQMAFSQLSLGLFWRLSKSATRLPVRASPVLTLNP